MALAQNSSLQESFFEDRKVLQRDIDWKYIPRKVGGKANHLTNWELAQKGNAPYDRDGGQIQLHHINQAYDGTLVEVPELYHKSKDYNLHEGSGHPDSFRNDTELSQEFDAFRKSYWINRSNNS